MSVGTDSVAPTPSSQVTRSRRGRRILGVVLAVLILLLGLSTYFLYRMVTPVGGNVGGSTAVDDGGLVWVRSIYGKSDAPADQFDQTQGVASAADGSLWITDGGHFTLMHFAADGRYLGETKGPADTPLQAPSRLAIGEDGKIYACETMGDSIRVIDPSNVTTDAGSFNIPQPVSVAVSDDRIAVGAVSGFAILEKSGKPIKVFGSRGKGDDQFDYVHGIAFDEQGNVYVADSYNNRLSAYDKDGNRLWIIRTGKPSNSAEQVNDNLTVAEPTDAALKGKDALQLPLGLTVDGAGRVVVIDMYDCTLAVFNADDGSFVGKYGIEGADDGQFFYPASVSYDAGRDWFTVADSLNNRVQIVRIPGSAGGSGVVATVRRAIAGPLRACIYPFLLLLVAFIVWLVVRRRRQKRDLDHEATDSDRELRNLAPTE
ncbi:MAG: hypothetical protein D9V44_00935 [Actinobacteria bacterium]|nr:MAG: hypothetical protein D9V44_00935 [Actinomycetota bacterium]